MHKRFFCAFFYLSWNEIDSIMRLSNHFSMFRALRPYFTWLGADIFVFVVGGTFCGRSLWLWVQKNSQLVNCPPAFVGVVPGLAHRRNPRFVSFRLYVCSDYPGLLSFLSHGCPWGRWCKASGGLYSIFTLWRNVILFVLHHGNRRIFGNSSFRILWECLGTFSISGSIYSGLFGGKALEAVWGEQQAQPKDRNLYGRTYIDQHVTLSGRDILSE